MLTELTIDHLGVISHSTVELADGLTVLTGETGAGKTMVVSGLRLLCGGRADAQRVRTGAPQAVVEGRFTAPEFLADTTATLVDNAGGTVDENGEYIATRTVNASGRSRAHLGGRSVPAATLAEFTADLLTIHGQNDQLRLLSDDKQREALDRFGADCQTLHDTYRQAYTTWRELTKELAEKTAQRRELAQEADRLQFAIDEISAVDPQPGEDIELQHTIRRLQDVDALREAALRSLAMIDGAADFEGAADTGELSGANDLLGQALGSLTGVNDEALAQIADRIGSITVALSDISAELGSFLSKLPSDPDALEKMLTRQQALKNLTRKYAPDVAGVNAWREKAEKKLARIDVSPTAIEELKKQVVAAEKTLHTAAKKLSQARARAAQELGEKVTEELHGLAMPKAVFTVAITPTEPGPHGADIIDFRLAPAPKLEAKPLATSASGGELSRVMLALEVIVSATHSGTTLVFDEVDAGVGGRAAVEIGRRLARLARHNQVIVVTHLPQVAAFADTHIHVSKDVGDESVTSAVQQLSDQQRVEELARMLAGLDDTDTGRAHAKELLATAQAEKNTTDRA
ncbi:DNA repair protein RecN [Corynebacterium aquilae]|uniref:DNA repair protein RecN n=1 Tax=Corynebacterium aquilae DSM 44791 TaxID=1431546 RepID=A0A1L7CFU9_9CORY|nr:DNA repair protein RecN [Corynebacterium aquilae]APT84695.1 DNA recombination protein RecN [Corynebacterium aquilae DSM 44791]